MPQYRHRSLSSSLPVAAGDVMAGLTRSYSRSRTGAGFLLLIPYARAAASFNRVSRSWEAIFL